MTGGKDRLAQLLRRAGLEIVADGRTEDVLRPMAAWRLVIAGDAEPTVAVWADRPDLVLELNARWRQLAVAYGLIDKDGVFLIDVAGNWTGCAPRRWTRVRLTAGWDLAGVLGEAPGRPEFVTLSADGDVLLGVTSEEYEVWLVAVDRVKERREAAARAADEETPQERAAAWASLLRGPKPPQRLREKWAHGLARNLAIPDDLRYRLLGYTRHLLWRPLPAAVIDQAICHPEWKVRSLLAEVQPNLTVEQWARLILGEQDTRHRWILTMLAADQRVELAEDAHARLAADPAARIRAETARLPALPTPIRTALAADPDPTVRRSACTSGWPDLDDPTRRRLLEDSDSTVRTAARLQHHLDHPLPRPIFDSEDLGEQAVQTCRLERDLAEHLAHHGNATQRRALARNPHLPPNLMAVLADDPDETVRFALSLRPELTEEQRAGLRIDIDPSLRTYALDWVVALHDDPDAMRRLAASSHLLIRRSAPQKRRSAPFPSDWHPAEQPRPAVVLLRENRRCAPRTAPFRTDAGAAESPCAAGPGGEEGCSDGLRSGRNPVVGKLPGPRSGSSAAPACPASC